MTAVSLKGLIPALAKAVDMTPAALYERQRALVRAGLLHSKAGRGPGSGVRATPPSVALLLIALLATGSLSETEEQTKILAKLKSETKNCPLTGKKTFATALTAILDSVDMSTQVGWIEVHRSGAKSRAIIGFKESPEEKTRTSEFGIKDARWGSRLSVRVTLTLPLQWIAGGLAEAKKRSDAPQMTTSLETPKQLAARAGLSERQVRSLIQSRQLEHVMIGCRVHIPTGAFERFIERKKVMPCLDGTKDPNCDGLKSAKPITSPGQPTVAAASARLARQTANRLKSSSPNGFSPEAQETAQVIHLSSS